MWTPEEKEERINSLLEFLNNEYKNQHKNQTEITVTELNDRFQRLQYIIGLERLLECIQYQIERRQGAPMNKKNEFPKESKGITNYISKASKDELIPLKERIEYHLQTVFTYGLIESLKD